MPRSPETRPQTRLGRWSRGLFWCCALGALVLALVPKPPHLPIDRFGDKFEHMLAFLVLTALAQLGEGRAGRWALALRLSVFGALIEVLQAIPALHRDSDLRDWVADTVMVLLVTVLFAARDRLRRR